MKLILIISFLISTVGFTQENPWENKNKENPWETEQEKENNETKQVEKNTSKANKSNVGTDTIYVNSTSFSKEELYQMAKIDAKENYTANGDFAFGFVTGLIFNVYGTVIDLVYVLPNSKKEKKAVKAIEVDPTYDSLNDENLKKKTENNVKGKKLGTTVIGTAAGAIVQLLALVFITTAL